MSHLTAPMPSQVGHRPPQQKPYLFDFPRPAQPLTPPDTDYETLSHQAPPAQNHTGLETDSLPPQIPSTVFDSPYTSPYATLHRKRPSVSYLHSGLKESRERVVQRGLKWLVVVVPPVSFTREHGHLGHTLSSGPSRRLSSGILMPLYPTLNSQLGAIAREFSFPSISGLCVYLHTTHGGVSLVPRVSDDTWPLLWGHLFDVRSPSLPSAQLPISGQIEFDIDMTKARWFDSWVASSRRDQADVPQSVAPSRPQSLSHWRGDSQGSLNDLLDDQTDLISLPQPPTRGPGRNIKKLSLLDRFDTASVRSGSRLVPRDESPPSQTAKQSVLQTLSPIVQEDEPATAKKDIDIRVQSWRMSASAAVRSPMAATGQTSLDPVNMPNTIEDLPTASASEFELKLEDYTWSISSAGPLDYDMESVYSWDRVPSVHLDRRGEGSVCLTASVCTSFGPDEDYEPLSPCLSRLPSPDIAWRMLEDVPPTPTTATSWGAPLSFPPSPSAYSYAPSVDIAGRFLISRPVTPTTATSWGAPLSFPPSPVEWSRPASPDLGWRTFDSAPNSPRLRGTGQSYGMVFPYYNAARAATWQHVWPYYDASRASSSQHVLPHTEHRQAERMNSFVFPATAQRSQQVEGREASTLALGYPVLDIYPAVYPSLDIYPALLTLDDRKLGAPAVSRGADYPIFDLYPAVYPSLNIYPATLTVAQPVSKELSIRLSSSYPNLEIYPAVYPCFAIYPAVSKVASAVAIANAQEELVPVVPVHSTSGYPVFDIYPAVYSRSLDRISSVRTASTSQLSTGVAIRLQASYPVFDLYPAIYPHSLDRIYPAVSESSSTSSAGIVVRLQACYPVFDIYPATYPHSLEQIYPSLVAEASQARSSVISVGVEWQYPVFDIYPSASGPQSYQVTKGVVVTLATEYPAFNLYPAAYPWNVYEIYPAVMVKAKNVQNGIVITLGSQYPVFNIYPPVYPFSMETIYPSITSSVTSAKVPVAKPNAVLANKVAGGHIRKPSWKRDLPPVPPLPRNMHALTPFSAVSGRPLPPARFGLTIPVESSAAYPRICPYPPVYPHFDLYPGATAEDRSSIKVELAGKELTVSRYPHLVIYPSVYPFIEIYPGSWGHSTTSATRSRLPQRRKPKHSHMELRAQVSAAMKATEVRSVRTRRQPKYTHMELRAQVLAQAKSTSTIASSITIPAPVPSPIRSPSSVRVMSSAPAPPPARPPPPVPVPAGRGPSSTSIPAQPMRRPIQMDLRDDDSHMAAPKIVAVEPSPTGSGADPESPVLFEMVTAPSPVLPPVPASAPAHARTRSRSGTVSRSPIPSPSSTPPRHVGARPLSIAQPPPSIDLPPVPSQRSLNRLSGLPAHPAVNRRMSSAVPRPVSAFVPMPAAAPSAPSAPPVVRRQTTLMSPLAEESSPVKGRSPQLPSPPDEWQRGWRTPTDGSSLLAGPRSADLSRSKTMPTRATPRGPRSSTLISERSKAFDNPNVVPNDDGPLKLSMLAEFPTPPRPPMPSPSPTRPVSKLDRTKYPFA